jgi:hypothetical protein
MTSHTHDARASGKPPNVKLKAPWAGGGQKQSDLGRSSITAPTALPQSQKIIHALTTLGKRRLTVADVPADSVRVTHNHSSLHPCGQGDTSYSPVSLYGLIEVTKMSSAGFIGTDADEDVV